MEIAQPQVITENKCAQCGKKSSLHCSRCQKANYCSAACQKDDWPAHSKKCEKPAPQEPVEELFLLARDNPLKALKKIENALTEEFFEAYNQLITAMAIDVCNENAPKEPLTQMNELIIKFEKKFPLLFVLECARAGDNPCPLARETRPKYREHFEKELSTALKQKITCCSKKAAVYTSFASGNLLPELLILIKTLTQFPDAEIALHCIDLCYKEYLSIRALGAPNPCEVTLKTNSLPFFLRNKKAILENARKHLPDCQNKTDFEIEIKLGYRFLANEHLCKQLLTCINKLFPQAKVSIFLYETARDYLACYKKQLVPAPDVISTIDIWDTASVETNAPNDYAKLCLELLQKNPVLKNFWLESYKEEDVCMQTFSLSLSPGFIKLGVLPMFIKDEKV